MVGTKIELKNKIHDILEYFRDLLADETIIRQIDAAYEKAILGSIDLIPEENISQVYEVIVILISVYRSVNFSTLCDNLERFGIEQTGVKIDLFTTAIEIIKEKIDDKQTVKVIEVFMKRFKKIINCFEVILQNPKKFLQRLASKDTSSLDNLL